MHIETRKLARKSDPHTSHLAASQVAQFSSAHYDAIITAMRKIRRPAGAHEIANRSKLTQVQVCKRLPELERMGFIEATELTRKTETGRSERLWRLL